MTTKKRLIIHAGSHKTATTFIQGSLKANSDQLLHLGILYPQAGQIYNAHFKLAWSLLDQSEEGNDLFDLEVWQSLFEEAMQSTAHTVVVSAEDFGFAIDPERLAPLKDKFDIQVIYYVRSPDSFLESYYNQIVKDFGTRETRTIHTYVAEEQLLFINPRRTLEPWMSVFGRDNLHVRIFAKDRLKEGILNDFFSTANLELPLDMVPPTVDVIHKTSLPPDALEYLRFANPHLATKDGYFQFVVNLGLVAEKNKENLSQTRAGILSHKARKALRFHFANQFTWLSQTFFDSDQNIFPVAEAPPPPADFNNRPEQADASILGKVAAMIHLKT